MQARLKQWINYFLIGVLAVIPIALIVQIVLFMKNLVTRLLIGLHGYSDSYAFTALVIALSFGFFIYIGYSTVRYGRSIIITGIDYVIDRLPFLNSVYRIAKRIIGIVRGEDQRGREVVYVEYPKQGLWVPAYVTNREKDMYVLFVPTSPNPTSGFTIIVHESRLVKSEMDIEEATRFIISIGTDCHKPEEFSRLS